MILACFIIFNNLWISRKVWKGKSKRKMVKKEHRVKRGGDVNSITEGVGSRHIVAVVVVDNRQVDQAVDHHIPCRVVEVLGLGT